MREVAKLMKLDMKNILDRQGYEVERERSEDELPMKNILDRQGYEVERERSEDELPMKG